MIPQPRSNHEQNILMKLSEIILTIHGRREFVSRERVQTVLFAHFRVNSLQQLGVRPGTLGPLMNLTDRLKKVIFFMQIFEQVVMLCTLYDLGSILAKFSFLCQRYANKSIERINRYNYRTFIRAETRNAQ